MRYLSVLYLFAAPCLAADHVESQTYEASGTPVEILERGRVCIQRFFPFDSVDVHHPSGAKRVGKTTLKGAVGGIGIEAIDTASLAIEHRGRVGYRSGLTAMNLQALMTFMVSGAQFKMRFTELASVVTSSNRDVAPSHEPLKTPPPAPAHAVLRATAERVAACVQRTLKPEWTL